MSSLPALTDFFNWRPVSLYPSTTASQSKASRKPSFYDKLLAENLILRRVRHLPSLAKDIAGTVDDALKTISDLGIDLPAASAGFPNQSIRSFVEKARPPTMQNEMSVAEFYGATTALFCTPVASTLALQSDLPSLPEWLNVLYWTVSPSKSGYAIADGSLQIIPYETDSPNHAATEAEKILYKSPLWPQLQRIRKILGDLAVWEFKSLSVGDHTTMLGIRNEAFTGIQFRWETIDNNERGRMSRRYNPPSIGPDAKETPWTLLLASDSNNNSNSPAEQINEKSALQPLSGEASTDIQATQGPFPIVRVTSMSPLTIISSDNDPEAAEQGHGQIVQPSQGEASTPTNPRGMSGRSRGGPRGRSSGRGKAVGRHRGKSRGRSVATQYPGLLSNKKRKRDDDNENYKSKQELTAESFIQQAWAQAVRHDATLIIIQSGNFEYVCVRHRATQTLYISDLIDVPNCENPGYAKLHIGIYMAALHDAMQRVKDIPDIKIVGQSSNIGHALEDNGNDEDDGHRRDPNQGSGKGKEREAGSGPGFGAHHKRNDEAAYDLKVDQVNRRVPDQCEDKGVKQIIMECDKRMGLLMHFQYGIYYSPVPAAFIRVSAPMLTPPPSPQHRRGFQADELVLVITSEIGTGATGIVHGGTLEVELSGQCVSLDIVAKLAFSRHQKERLAHENAIYLYLSSRHIRGIPTLLGLFNSIDGGPSALLLSYNGVSITCDTQLSPNIRENYLMILQEIHKVGIVHNDIRPQNLLIDNLGHASIIDFDQAEKTSSAKAMEEEFLHLIDLLNS